MSGGSDAAVMTINLAAEVFLENQLTSSGPYTNTYLIIGVSMVPVGDTQPSNTTGLWINKIAWALDYIP